MKKTMKIAAIFALMLVYNLVVFTPAALAYIDPSTTTYLIQAVAGIAVAVGSFAVIYWRKAKKKIANTLHIDENAKKEVEEDIQITDDDE